MQLFSQTIDMIESKEVQEIYNENKKIYKCDYFPSIHNFIYLNNFYDSKFANLINVLDGEIAK